ncbi:NAD-dependent epimerase/dehydratase family protein [Paenibacillus sp. SI8]|uniref:NAD-dependent epimerase/dehydratase family protein n=1 Tax=unclassified Paenibacillus TaxID=185978 RepID=UPI00346639DD
MENIFILGCGYLGFSLAHFFNDKNHNVTVLGFENDYSKRLNTEIKFFNTRFTNLDELNQFNFTNAIIVNALGTINAKNKIDDIIADISFYETICNLHLYLSEYNIKRIFFISSGGTIYGNTIEDMVDENTKENPTNIYGLQRLFIEHFIKINNIENKIPYTIFRLANPYGGYQLLNKNQGIIPILINNILNNKHMDFWVPLHLQKDYINILDCCRAFEHAICNNNMINETYNLGSGTSISLLDLITKVEDATCKKLNYSNNFNDNDVFNNYSLDVSKLSNAGFKSIIDLDFGINEEIKRIRSTNYINQL